MNPLRFPNPDDANALDAYLDHLVDRGRGDPQPRDAVQEAAAAVHAMAYRA